MKTRLFFFIAMSVISVSALKASPTEYTGTESGLIALYHMEDSFEGATDVIAITNVAGTPAQTAWVSGNASLSVPSMEGFGNALSPQSGSSIYRAGGNDWNDAAHANFTAESWVKWSAGEYAADSIQAILYSGASTNPNQYEWRIYAQNNRMYFYWSNDASAQAIASDFVPEDDTWYHIAVTYEENIDGISSTTKMYITEAGITNANLVASKTDGITMDAADKDYRFYIGCFTTNYTTSRYLRGDIDEVAVFDYAKTADEFTTLVPEPATLGLLSIGILSVCCRRRQYK